MATDPNKTVFISYRRSVSSDRALLIFYHLRQNGYDVFLDIKTIDGGPFDSVILNQIGARTHFVLLIVKGALERCQHEGDWLRREIEEALKLGRNIVPVIDEGINFDQEMRYLPDTWHEKLKIFNYLPWSNFFFDSVLHDLVERFLKPPNFPVKIIHLPTDKQHVIEPYTTSLEIMPQPFNWVTIPAGKVILTDIKGYLKERTNFDVATFQMAKYPITNAQFDVFINHPDGYKDPQWWAFSEDAKKWRTKNIKPDSKIFDSDNHPRVNVCWYEAVAFCLWLSTVTGEKIMLPTEQEWQRAAQGDDEREYPWGNEWDKKRCNNSVSVKNWRGQEIGKSESTTPVTQYEGVGDSPFGVVDMVGNVWNRCVTSHETGNIGLLGTDVRVLRGGSWKHQILDTFRIINRIWDSPHLRSDDVGFRIVRF